ncbi:hypothetical protein Glove_168g272 [Diversispora epigaea]|uniref:Uncharacterized protein n=1 Tax=Diversispora epigaea TaxID=1348612 RepID=A0A397ITC1_9GLOM|nr:hypothetical protein Glove_168g272 [Diversispora epigaea]
MNYNEKVEGEFQHKFDYEYKLHQYELWEQNAIRKIERAREVGRKIRAVNIIAQKWLEYMYRPDGLCATELTQHYKLLWAVREEMRQINLLQI